MRQNKTPAGIFRCSSGCVILFILYFLFRFNLDYINRFVIYLYALFHFICTLYINRFKAFILLQVFWLVRWPQIAPRHSQSAKDIYPYYKSQLCGGPVPTLCGRPISVLCVLVGALASNRPSPLVSKSFTAIVLSVSYYDGEKNEKEVNKMWQRFRLRTNTFCAPRVHTSYERDRCTYQQAGNKLRSVKENR